jgi:hypothetical protein
MYVVRVVSIDGIASCKAFTSRTMARSDFEVRQNQVIDEVMKESALFMVGSARDPRIATQLVRVGRATLLDIYPPPMAEVEAAAWLADFEL